ALSAATSAARSAVVASGAIIEPACSGRLRRPITGDDAMAAEWIAYLTAAKTALDLVKGLRSELPKGDKSDQIEKNIDDAERALKASEAELAKGLGYRI